MPNPRTLDNIRAADICELLEYLRPYEISFATALRKHEDSWLANIVRSAGREWERDGKLSQTGEQ